MLFIWVFGIKEFPIVLRTFPVELVPPDDRGGLASCGLIIYVLVKLVELNFNKKKKLTVLHSDVQ